MGNNETTPLHLDSLLGEFTLSSESQISETKLMCACLYFHIWQINKELCRVEHRVLWWYLDQMKLIVYIFDKNNVESTLL